ncbi:MAG: hypothetical protein M3R65_10435 [Gemmatimonadota bacterium]|nr:hypothetical protein [Gemmatimonadota bacterium]
MMNDRDIVVGVDAGGSKTRVLVSAAGGEVLAEHLGSGAAMVPGNAEHCAGVISGLVGTALASAECSHVTPRVLYVGAAGAGREVEQAALQNALIQRDIADETVVESDASIGLADAFGDGSGILLLAGTGSIAYGRGPSGFLARCGGWGSVFGDEGSGTWIGRRALSVVAAAHDGREPETALTGAILTAAQLNEPEELIPWAIAADRESIAALAPSVFAMAMQEDVRANSIVDMAVEELTLHVRALARRLFLDDRSAFDLAFAGGLMHRGSLLRKRMERRLRGALPGAALRTEEVDAARGAVKLALRLALVAR